MLLTGADEQRRSLDSVTYIECADALRRVELVAGDRQQVDTKRIHIDSDLAERLRRIGVDQRANLSREPRDVGDGLQRADLVLRVDDRDQSVSLRRKISRRPDRSGHRAAWQCA